MTTNGKSYYIVCTSRYTNTYVDNSLSYVDVNIDTSNGYHHEEPCYYDGYSVSYESYETLDEVKAMIEQVAKLGCRTNFRYSWLHEADVKSLDEYIAKAKQKDIPNTVDEEYVGLSPENTDVAIYASDTGLDDMTVSGEALLADSDESDFGL